MMQERKTARIISKSSNNNSQVIHRVHPKITKNIVGQPAIVANSPVQHDSNLIGFAVGLRHNRKAIAVRESNVSPSTEGMGRKHKPRDSQIENAHGWFNGKVN